MNTAPIKAFLLFLCACALPCSGAEKSRLVTQLEAGTKQVVVAYGTSLTSDGAWVAQMTEVLNQRFPGLATVINSGASGQWSGWGVTNLENRVLSKQPDTVFIEYAINDCAEHFKGTVEIARNNLESMIESIRKTNPQCEIILMAMTPGDGFPEGHRSYRKGIEGYYEMYRSVAKERKLMLIDHYPNWKALESRDRALFQKFVPDTIHPTAEGCSKVVTPVILEALGIKASTPLLTRIAFLGDSITAGVGVQDRAKDRYATVTTRLLASTHPAITEFNLGQSGRALCQQDAGYGESVLQRNPDAVVIQWGVNDHFWGFSVAEFVARYDALVATLRAAKPQMPIVVMTLIADFRWPENPDAWIGEANVALQEIAARHRCHLADAHRAFDRQKKFYADPIHPNTAGAELMAKTIVEALQAPPLSPENAGVSFDQGTEVRFLQNVFLPRGEGTEPQWVHVSGINSNGMSLASKIPIAIRTAPIYPEGKYRITFREQSGAVVDTTTSVVNWSKMQRFTFDPKGRDGPLRIEIAPEKSAEK